MNQEKIKNILEAALMVADKPLNMTRLQSLFGRDEENIERDTLRSAIEQLQQDYASRGIELSEVASGYRIQVKSDYAEWINRLFDEKPPRYSRALLETLAIIAYRQPLTRAEIEDIRGVGVSTTIVRTLQEREWIRVVGHKDVPGKPELLATTKEFLDYFNLKKLSDLPTLAEIKELNDINPDLFDELEKTDHINELETSDLITGNLNGPDLVESNINNVPDESGSPDEDENDALDRQLDEEHKVVPITG